MLKSGERSADIAKRVGGLLWAVPDAGKPDGETLAAEESNDDDDGLAGVPVPA